MELGKKIKQRREELGMSQEELAKKLNYKSRSTINKIELGKNDITQHKIVAFAKALQTTPAYLMGWVDDEETEKKNDTITDIILKLRSDSKLLKIVKDICKLSPEQQTAVQNLISAFNNNK